MLRRIDPVLTARARYLRNNPTPAERAMWQRVSHYRPAFTRQLIVPPFIVDLACRSAKLAIELDGSQHLDTVAKDESRSAYLRRKAWTVLRLWNSDLLGNPDGAAEYILAQAAECLGGTHPVPGEQRPALFTRYSLPSREGRARKPRYV